jgi:hypothetical protein
MSESLAEVEWRETAHRLRRLGVRVVAPVVAAGMVACGVLGFDDGSGWPVTHLLWMAPVMVLVLGFVGFLLGMVIGGGGALVAERAWKRSLFDEALELVGVGAFAGGALAGLVLALYLTAW